MVSCLDCMVCARQLGGDGGRFMYRVGGEVMLPLFQLESGC